jgi:response regulator NasT
MEQNGIGEAAAYTRLRRTAMDRSCKIADIARAVVTAAELLNPGDSS